MIWWNNSSATEYKNKYALSFRRGQKEVKPYFIVKQTFPEIIECSNTSNIKGYFKNIFFNEAKDITKKDWTQATIPPQYSIQLEDWEELYYVQISTECWNQLRPLLNSLLGVEKWEYIEIATYISWAWYKVISVSNPNEKIEIESRWKKVTVNKWYPWVYYIKDIPEVEIIKNKKWEFVSSDDSEANDFFKEKIIDKFSVKIDDVEELSVEDCPF